MGLACADPQFNRRITVIDTNFAGYLTGGNWRFRYIAADVPAAACQCAANQNAVAGIAEIEHLQRGRAPRPVLRRWARQRHLRHCGGGRMAPLVIDLHPAHDPNCFSVGMISFAIMKVDPPLLIVPSSCTLGHLSRMPRILNPVAPELTNFSPRVSSAWVGPAKLAPGGALRQGTLGNGMAYLRLGTGPPQVFLPGLSSHR